MTTISFTNTTQYNNFMSKCKTTFNNNVDLEVFAAKITNDGIKQLYVFLTVDSKTGNCVCVKDNLIDLNLFSDDDRDLIKETVVDRLGKMTQLDVSSIINTLNDMQLL